MTTRCQVCNHRLVRDADSMFNAGASAAAVARMLGASVQSAKRHRHAGHVVPSTIIAPLAVVVAARKAAPRATPKAASNVAPTSDPADAQGDPAEVADPSAAGQLDLLRDELDAMLAGPLSPTAKMAIIAEKRRVIEAKYRVVGPAPSEMIRLDSIEGYAEYEGSLMSALEPFPDARRALAMVLRERLAHRGEA